MLTDIFFEQKSGQETMFGMDSAAIHGEKSMQYIHQEIMSAIQNVNYLSAVPFVN